MLGSGCCRFGLVWFRDIDRLMIAYIVVCSAVGVGSWMVQTVKIRGGLGWERGLGLGLRVRARVMVGCDGYGYSYSYIHGYSFCGMLVVAVCTE